MLKMHLVSIHTASLLLTLLLLVDAKHSSKHSKNRKRWMESSYSHGYDQLRTRSISNNDEEFSPLEDSSLEQAGQVGVSLGLAGDKNDMEIKNDYTAGLSDMKDASSRQSDQPITAEDIYAQDMASYLKPGIGDYPSDMPNLHDSKPHSRPHHGERPLESFQPHVDSAYMLEDAVSSLSQNADESSMNNEKVNNEEASDNGEPNTSDQDDDSPAKVIDSALEKITNEASKLIKNNDNKEDHQSSSGDGSGDSAPHHGTKGDGDKDLSDEAFAMKLAGANNKNSEENEKKPKHDEKLSDEKETEKSKQNGTETNPINEETKQAEKTTNPSTETTSGKIDEEKPNSKIDGETPSSKIDEEKNSSKIGGEKPSSKIDEEKPSSKIDGEKPNSKIDGENPNSKIDDEKPSSKIDGEKPSSKIDDEKPTKIDGEKPSSKIDGEKPSSKIDGEKPNSKINGEKSDENSESDKQDTNENKNVQVGTRRQTYGVYGEPYSPKFHEVGLPSLQYNVNLMDAGANFDHTGNERSTGGSKQDDYDNDKFVSSLKQALFSNVKAIMNSDGNTELNGEESVRKEHDESKSDNESHAGKLPHGASGLSASEDQENEENDENEKSDNGKKPVKYIKDSDDGKNDKGEKEKGDKSKSFKTEKNKENKDEKDLKNSEEGGQIHENKNVKTEETADEQQHHPQNEGDKGDKENFGNRQNYNYGGSREDTTESHASKDTESNQDDDTNTELLEENLMKIEKKKLVHLLAKFMRSRKKTERSESRVHETDSNTDQYDGSSIDGNSVMSTHGVDHHQAHVTHQDKPILLQNSMHPKPLPKLLYFHDTPSVRAHGDDSTSDARTASKNDFDPYANIGLQDPEDGAKPVNKTYNNSKLAEDTSKEQERKLYEKEDGAGNNDGDGKKLKTEKNGKNEKQGEEESSEAKEMEQQLEKEKLKLKKLKDENDKEDKVNSKFDNNGKSSDNKFDGNGKSSDNKFDNNGKSSDNKFDGNGKSSDNKFEGNEKSSDNKFDGNGKSSDNKFEGNGKSSDNKFDGNVKSSDNKFKGNEKSSDNKFDDNGKSSDNKFDDNGKSSDNKFDGNVKSSDNKFDDNGKSSDSKFDGGKSTDVEIGSNGKTEDGKSGNGEISDKKYIDEDNDLKNVDKETSDLDNDVDLNDELSVSNHHKYLHGEKDGIQNDIVDAIANNIDKTLVDQIMQKEKSLENPTDSDDSSSSPTDSNSVNHTPNEKLTSSNGDLSPSYSEHHTSNHKQYKNSVDDTSNNAPNTESSSSENLHGNKGDDKSSPTNEQNIKKLIHKIKEKLIQKNKLKKLAVENNSKKSTEDIYAQIGSSNSSPSLRKRMSNVKKQHIHHVTTDGHHLIGGKKRHHLKQKKIVLT